MHTKHTETMKQEISSKITKQQLVPWRQLKWLQSSKLKDLGARGIEKLKNSLKENNFVQPFNVWQDSKGVVWILDGHHREKALKQLEAEGFQIPDLLPANFVDCADRKDAGKMVLVYSSIYAKITNDGLGEFLDDFDLDLSNILDEIDLPGLDLDNLLPTKELPADADEAPPVLEKAYSILGDVFEIDGKHRVMCGDSTKESDVTILMNGKKADMVFTSPPYNTGNFNLTQSKDKKQYAKNIYRNKEMDIKTKEENIEFNKKIFEGFERFVDGNILYNLSYNQRSPNDWVRIINNCLDMGFYLHETIVWKKSSAVPLQHRLTRQFEFIFLFSTYEADRPRTNQKKNETTYNFWEISNTGVQQETHNACFPVALAAKGIELFADRIVLEPFLGSGSTLIAAESTKRICYGMELDQHYCDVILRRYKKTYPEAQIKCLTRPDFPFEELFDAVE